MVRAISVCRRRSTGSVLQLEIPSDIISEAVDIAESDECSDQDDAVTLHLMKYIAVNCPNAGDWDIQLEPLFTIVNDGDIVVIPSKVLGSGVIEKKVTVGALNFSNDAKRKISSAGGTTLSIAELWEKHPKGTDVRLLR